MIAAGQHAVLTSASEIIELVARIQLSKRRKSFPMLVATEDGVEVLRVTPILATDDLPLADCSELIKCTTVIDDVQIRADLHIPAVDKRDSELVFVTIGNEPHATADSDARVAG